MRNRLNNFYNCSLKFDVSDVGPLDSPGAGGAVVVALHGFPQTKESWRRVATELADRGVRTITPDQRGYSPGARPVARRDYALPHLVSDVAALIDAIGAPVHLVGHDWGAFVGWGTVVSRPDVVRSYTALSVPHPDAFLAALWTSWQWLRSWYMAAFQVPIVPERILRAISPGLAYSWRKSGLDDESIAIIRRRVLETGALSGGMHYYRAMPFGLGAGRGTVSIPTTFAWGCRDAYMNRTGAVGTAAHVIADYRFVEIDSGGHWLPETHPVAVADLVLDRINSTRR